MACSVAKVYGGAAFDVDCGTCRSPCCAEDEYVDSSHTCTACPAGSTRPAGDDAAGAPTQCTGGELVIF